LIERKKEYINMFKKEAILMTIIFIGILVLLLLATYLFPYIKKILSLLVYISLNVMTETPAPLIPV